MTLIKAEQSSCTVGSERVCSTTCWARSGGCLTCVRLVADAEVCRRLFVDAMEWRSWLQLLVV